ncbi:MAG: adenine deaminase [Lachnospiraceae bacterium]|nr:adenine deaminase [Candidatus Equihabitans merdae]
MDDFTLASNVERRRRIINAAVGKVPADLVFKNASFVNVFTQEIEVADIAVTAGVICGVGSYKGKEEVDCTGKILVPGFVDAHLHLESTLLTPREFIKAVLPHGTTTVIADPHEIANVMGVDGIRYMMQSTQGLPVDVRFMISSCVPATPEDEPGDKLSSWETAPFYNDRRVAGLAEMMNFFGVIDGDEEILRKLELAFDGGRKVDGHAPGLRGNALNAYIASGVSSDHECYDLDEAMEKLRRGMYILIREGTACHNLAALMPLLKSRYADRCMFCTDDKHPNDILGRGHIDYIVKTAIANGVSPGVAIKAASLNPARHYQIDHQGAIAPGYQADLILIDNFDNFDIQRVYKKGVLAFDGEVRTVPKPRIEKALQKKIGNSVHVAPITADNFKHEGDLPIIGLVKGEIISTDEGKAPGIDTSKDIVKVAVVERHHATGHVGVGLLKHYGLKKGAVATTIAHDAHNIIVVGTNEEDMAYAVNELSRISGGIVVVENGETKAELPLEIAGLMTERPILEVNEKLEMAKKVAHRQGVSRSIDPFMTLSFMSLTVIPSLRITTHGVYDMNKRCYIS